MSDLETLIPQAVELVIDGEPLAIKPLKVGQMPAFLRAITPVMQQIGGDGIDWLALFGERGDDLLTAVSIAVGKPRAWVDELAADEAILLAAKVIEVNADDLDVKVQAGVTRKALFEFPLPTPDSGLPSGALILLAMLIGMAVWEVKSPTTMRKGFLPLEMGVGGGISGIGASGPRTRFSKNPYSGTQRNLTVPVGPLRCLPIMASAMPLNCESGL